MAELQISGGDLADGEIGLAQGRGQQVVGLGGERQPAHRDAPMALAERESGRLELHIGRLTLHRRESNRHLGATLERCSGQRRPGGEIGDRGREPAARLPGGQRVVQLARDAAARRRQAEARQADGIGGSGEARLQPRLDALRRAGKKRRRAELALRMVEIIEIERGQPDLGREPLGQRPVGADPLPVEIER